jgi:hypothetical protein
MVRSKLAVAIRRLSGLKVKLTTSAAWPISEWQTRPLFASRISTELLA